MKKKSTAKKVLLTIIGVLLALVIVLVGTVYVIWHDEITTLLSFQQVTQRDESHKDGSVYVLNVSGGYHFVEFLAQGGASNDTELISFITNSITKGIIPMSIKTSEIACSAFTADMADGDRVFRPQLRFPRDEHSHRLHESGQRTSCFLFHGGLAVPRLRQHEGRDHLRAEDSHACRSFCAAGWRE